MGEENKQRKMQEWNEEEIRQQGNFPYISQRMSQS